MRALWSTLRFSDPRELELRATRFFQQELVSGNPRHVNCRGKRCLNLDSIVVAEPIDAFHIANKNSAIGLELPNRLIGGSRHPPFADDAGISAPGYDTQQKRRSNYP